MTILRFSKTLAPKQLLDMKPIVREKEAMIVAEMDEPLFNKARKLSIKKYDLQQDKDILAELLETQRLRMQQAHSERSRISSPSI